MVLFSQRCDPPVCQTARTGWCCDCGSALPPPPPHSAVVAPCSSRWRTAARRWRCRQRTARARRPRRGWSGCRRGPRTPARTPSRRWPPAARRFQAGTGCAAAKQRRRRGAAVEVGIGRPGNRPMNVRRRRRRRRPTADPMTSNIPTRRGSGTDNGARSVRSGGGGRMAGRAAQETMHRTCTRWRRWSRCRRCRPRTGRRTGDPPGSGSCGAHAQGSRGQNCFRKRVAPHFSLARLKAVTVGVCGC